MEAIANGCIFLQPKFNPPHSSLNHDFFRGKPTSREVYALKYASFTDLYVISRCSFYCDWEYVPLPQVSSQHPYAEQHIGRPHVFTIDFNNSEEFDATIGDIMKINVSKYFLYFA